MENRVTNMSRLRAQVSGDPKPLHEVKSTGRPPEPAPQKPARIRADLAGLNSGVGIIAFASVLAAFWAGSSSAFLRGYLEAQGANFAGWSIELEAFAAIVIVLPPLLFLAAAYAMSRAIVMGDTARRLAAISERLTSADES